MTVTAEIVTGPAQADIEEILRERHEGKRDVTVITQDAVLATFDRILRALTLAVGGLAAISRITSYNVCYTKLLRFRSAKTACRRASCADRTR